MSRIPFSLIVDDGSPVSSLFVPDAKHDPLDKDPVSVPDSFTHRFAEICRTHQLRGKYSVIPIPGGLGRLDRSIPCLTQEDITAFTKIVREEIMPMFSITPEILTHQAAYNLKTETCFDFCENVFVRDNDRNAIAEYVGLALQILRNVDIEPSGVTSPWNTGIDNEIEYAAGIGMAFQNVLNKNHCFYFLHSSDHVRKPVLMFDTPETGRVVSIPALSPDPFWRTQKPTEEQQARDIAMEGIDYLLSEDGKTGHIPDLIEKGEPVILLTHWQSLFSDGRAIGLEGLDFLAQRIRKYYGDTAEWMSFSEIEARTK